MPSAVPSARVPQELRGRALHEVLHALLGPPSGGGWSEVVRRGEVSVDGRPAFLARAPVRGGEELLVRPRGPALLDPLVLFEDDDLVAIDKPAGLLVQGTERTSGPTVHDLLAERGLALPRGAGAPLPGLVHRLDRDTTGVLVAAKTPRALRRLRGQFRRRSAAKVYLALAWGAPGPESRSIRAALAPGETPLRERVAEPGSGKEAHTEVRVRELLGPLSLLELCPTTGRRHQLRLHLAHAGHPLLCDPLYGRRGGAALPPAAPRIARQALHAAELRLEHPATGAPLRLVAPLPRDLADLVDALRAA